MGKIIHCGTVQGSGSAKQVAVTVVCLQIQSVTFYVPLVREQTKCVLCRLLSRDPNPDPFAACHNVQMIMTYLSTT